MCEYLYEILEPGIVFFSAISSPTETKQQQQTTNLTKWVIEKKFYTPASATGHLALEANVRSFSHQFEEGSLQQVG